MDGKIERQIERIAAAIQAHRLILTTLASLTLQKDSDPPAGARVLKAAMGDRFADAPPNSKMDPEQGVRLNHLAAHFVEDFWEDVAKTLEARAASPD